MCIDRLEDKGTKTTPNYAIVNKLTTIYWFKKLKKK